MLVRLERAEKAGDDSREGEEELLTHGDRKEARAEACCAAGQHGAPGLQHGALGLPHEAPPA